MATPQHPLARRVAATLKDRTTHSALAATCVEFGMPTQIADDGGSKFDRILARLANKTPREIAVIAGKIGAHYRDIELEETAAAVLEAGDAPLTEITRRDVARCFDPPPLAGDLDLLDLLRRIWPIDSMGDFLLGEILSTEIHQHMVRNDDWSVEYLLERLGAFTCSRSRFCRLVEQVMHPLARRGPEQEQLRDRLNAVLRRDGYQLESSGFESGYPIYRVVSMTPGVAGRPKNLVFASIGPKPEIGFRDAINNDMVILSNVDSCLIYDRPIRGDGLLWSELVDWWRAEYCGLETSEEDARRLLGRRLRESLASDGELGLFDEYFKCFRNTLGNALPALIPQVYLHYDPAVLARIRHRQQMPRQRMDFLLLLPHSSRVVLEVDGKHHFSRDNQPSLAAYAEMARADRELRLFGYEVYRFGANELVGSSVTELVRTFFSRLFEKHRVEASPTHMG